MWISHSTFGNMHLNIVQGDFVFKEWDENGWRKFRKQVNELRMKGYRKIDQEHDNMNYYEYYRKKGHKKVVTVTMMCY